jgi:polysaccharide pyruvyl transferase WcaK-like protein
MKIRILVDSGNYFANNDNQGDRALYRVIVRRLRNLWPESEIRWITRNEALLQATCPGVSQLLLNDDRLPLVLPPLSRALDQAGQASMPNRRRADAAGTIGPNSRSERRPNLDSERILSAVRNCDLVLATGGGYFSDCFAEHAWSILDTLEAGVRFGKPAGILSCGFEPIRNAALSEKMLLVLPQLSLITCREPIQSVAVVRSFGVAEQQLALAGDDAVELAFEARPSVLGNGLGINLRQATYSGVDASTVERISETLQKAAEGLAAPLIPVPISMSGPSDPDVISTLLARSSNYIEDGRALKTPEDIVRQAGRCRLVVTGSYHAAVFALAQGISVVALTASSHYRAKFKGLQAHFGAACRIVTMHRGDTNQALKAAIEEGWHDAESARPQLLEAAERQLAANQDSYRRLQDIVDSPRESKRTQASGCPGPPKEQTTLNSSVPNQAHHIDGVSRIENFERPTMQATTTETPNQFKLSSSEMDTFRKQGFLGPFTAFQPEEMERVRKIICDRVLPTPTPHCPFGLRVRHLDSSTVYELCSSPAIVGRMQSLFGPDLILWNSNLFNKPPAEPGRSEEYPWHQDHYNWQMEPVLNISAWLAITPATPDNGCVEVIPGSHRLVIPSIRDTDPRLSLRFGGVASDPAYVDATKKVAMTLEPGQFFLFNERLLHHSNPNRTETHRLGLAIRATIPIVKVSEPFPCLLLTGQDRMGFNNYVDRPVGEPDAEWLASLPDGHEFTFDRPIPGMGWHLREIDGPCHFAWTGLESDSWIDFRPLGEGDHVLRCEVIHWLAPQSLDGVRVRVNGHLASVHRRHADKAVILEARIANNILQSRSDRVRVSLQVRNLLRPCDLNPASEDKRSLGLGVCRVSLTPAGNSTSATRG